MAFSIFSSLENNCLVNKFTLNYKCQTVSALLTGQHNNSLNNLLLEPHVLCYLPYEHLFSNYW